MDLKYLTGLPVAALFLCCLPHQTNAQSLKGNTYVGLQLDMTLSSSKANWGRKTYSNPKATRRFSFSPNFGYYFNDKMAAGLELGFSISQNTSVNLIQVNDTILNEIVNKSTFKSFAFSPAFRYTRAFSNKFVLNIDLALPYRNSKSSNEYSQNILSGGFSSASQNINLPGNAFRLDEFGVRFSPSLQWFVGKNFAISGSFGSISYQFTRIRDFEVNAIYMTNVESKSNGFNLSLSTDFTFGVSFFLHSIK